MSPDDGDICSCDVCATGWHSLTGEQKLAKLAEEQDAGDVEHWHNYAVSLEGENYDLQRQLSEAESELAEADKEIAELEDALAAEQARCQNCGAHK